MGEYSEDMEDLRIERKGSSKVNTSFLGLLCDLECPMFLGDSKVNTSFLGLLGDLEYLGLIGGNSSFLGDLGKSSGTGLCLEDVLDDELGDLLSSCWDPLFLYLDGVMILRYGDCW